MPFLPAGTERGGGRLRSGNEHKSIQGPAVKESVRAESQGSGDPDAQEFTRQAPQPRDDGDQWDSGEDHDNYQGDGLRSRAGELRIESDSRQNVARAGFGPFLHPPPRRQESSLRKKLSPQHLQLSTAACRPHAQLAQEKM